MASCWAQGSELKSAYPGAKGAEFRPNMLENFTRQVGKSNVPDLSGSQSMSAKTCQSAARLSTGGWQRRNVDADEWRLGRGLLLGPGLSDHDVRAA